MRILAFNAGHDGSAVYVRDQQLIFSYESEKNNFPRYSPLTASTVLDGLSRIDDVPEVIAVGGWVKNDMWSPIEAGYFGVGREDITAHPMTLFGKSVTRFSSTHEKAHLFATYGLSPFPQGQPCYVLVWEGSVGNFYEIDEALNITLLGQALDAPGNRYAALFALADPKVFPTKDTFVGPECAGKLMALAAYGIDSKTTTEERELIEHLLNDSSLGDGHRFDKIGLSASPWFNVGVESQVFKSIARKHSDAVFDRFFRFAEQNATKGFPLLISGGCGLNCEWNSRWASSGLFSDVFVPPCPSDTGSAIGTAVEAMYLFSGHAKLSWSVYVGQEFIDDPIDLTGLDVRPLNVEEVARFLASGKIIAWVQGRCEIGPRALGNRSILAAPFSADVRDRLNEIKQREGYRPIAPVCIEDDVNELFDWNRASPHMLYFQKVRSQELHAVTHIDGSARLQTVRDQENSRLYSLLTAFKKQTGFGVLCNTSLNFKGAGFINQKSDLLEYVRARGLDGFVIENTFFTIKQRLT